MQYHSNQPLGSSSLIQPFLNHSSLDWPDLILKKFNDEINSITKKKNIIKDVNEILNLTDVSISYAKQKFLDQIFNKITDTNPTVKDINIEINKGETIALVGESGSGKSTIL